MFMMFITNLDNQEVKPLLRLSSSEIIFSFKFKIEFNPNKVNIDNIVKDNKTKIRN